MYFKREIDPVRGGFGFDCFVFIIESRVARFYAAASR